MHPPTSPRNLLLAFATLATLSSAAPDNESTKPSSTASSTTASATGCVATSAAGAFFDLRPDTAVLVTEGEKPPKGVPTEDYIARGWDFGSNFTLNICDPVVKKVKDVEGVEEEGWNGVNTTRRKSATISFLCDRDPDTPTAFSFIGTDPDECAYFFEVRSQHACAGAEPHKPGSVGPGSVFAIIFFITVLVYVVGGVFYQRTVAHARGWRQLPNWSLWAGIWGFVRDLAIILTASCARMIPRTRGYRTLSGSPNGRRRSRDDENRLIDQLDEEWDD
ncbi:Cation-independent mannose-6-phosphate receptor CI-MPR [Collariella sp. IMI 366227]|nr:Cation-independent mannose-6-phosphate receptor CI-MPR [Collariella sp. IMI 366227]